MSERADAAPGRPDPSEPSTCDLVMGRVWEFLDSELDEATEDQIRLHLIACEACLNHVDAEQAIKALVARCCRGEAAPSQVRQRIVAALRLECGGGPDADGS